MDQDGERTELCYFNELKQKHKGQLLPSFIPSMEYSVKLRSASLMTCYEVNKQKIMIMYFILFIFLL